MGVGNKITQPHIQNIRQMLDNIYDNWCGSHN